MEPWADAVCVLLWLPIPRLAGGATGDISLGHPDLGEGSQEEQEVAKSLADPS